jgi:hypothetical protein
LDFLSAIAISTPLLSWRDRSRKSLNIERSPLQKWAIAITADAFVAEGRHASAKTSRTLLFENSL